MLPAPSLHARILAVLAFVLVPGSAWAQSVTFTEVVGTGDAVPGGTLAGSTGIDGASFDGANIAFWGLEVGGGTAIYRVSPSGSITEIAESGDPWPPNEGPPLQVGPRTLVSGDQVIFPPWKSCALPSL